MIEKIKAMLRLARIKERNVNRESLRNDLYTAMESKLTDFEIAKTLKEISEMHANKVLQKKQRLEREFLEVERTDDFTRLNLV